MKKTTITTALLLTLFVGFGQAKKDTIVTDTLPFISLADINRISVPLQEKNTYRDYAAYLKILNEMVGTLINEYNDKHKAKR